MAKKNEEVVETVGKVTLRGWEAMSQIANGGVSFFDQGIEVESGSWANVLNGEIDANPRSGARVMAGLVKRGFFEVSHGGEEGAWYSLTEKGVKKCEEILAWEKANKK